TLPDNMVVKRRSQSNQPRPPRQFVPDQGENPDDEGEPSAVGPSAASRLGQLLITAQAELEAIAESGLSVRRDLSLLRGAHVRLEAIGLSVAAEPLGALLRKFDNPTALTQPEVSQQTADLVLRLAYVLQLCGVQETLASACAELDRPALTPP
ncbi:MAG: hypothetical protein KDA41_15055, partial [Planctomycetales bacterium]|nr:hypothetical protein [Planctomycetales bacterium]